MTNTPTAEIKTEAATVTSTPRPMSTLERITLLSDLANAVQDVDIAAAMSKRPNGTKLHALFVEAISAEIERMMNPAQPIPKAMASASEMAGQIFTSLNRIGALLGAIEGGLTIGTLRALVQSLDGHPPPQLRQQQTDYNQPQETQTQNLGPRDLKSHGVGSW